MKKRVIPLLLALALLMLTFVPAATAAGITKYVYTRNGKPLNVRAWPSVNSSLLGTIPNGSAISVENYTTDYTWAVIRYNGQTASAEELQMDSSLTLRADGVGSMRSDDEEMELIWSLTDGTLTITMADGGTIGSRFAKMTTV